MDSPMIFIRRYPMKTNPCTDCDSTSMEMCLLIRHCEYWAVRDMNKEETEEIKETNIEHNQ